MNYASTPSLEHIALVKIATTLWNQDDIRTLIARFNFPSLQLGEREKWREIEDKVIEKVPLLPQPKPLKEKVIGSVKPIGLQILKWMEEYRDKIHCLLYIDTPNELCWTPQGTVDKKKTAEVLIKNGNLHSTTRYKLACIYCLEDDILELWNKIPETCKIFFYDEDPSEVRQDGLVVLWTYGINGEVSKMDNILESKVGVQWGKLSPFEYAATKGNKPATEYFLLKLTTKEREKSLVRSAKRVITEYCAYGRNAPKERYAEVLCFLLSQMDEQQQKEVFKSNPYQVLIFLLDWPWQRLFMETANRMWVFFSNYDCYCILAHIVYKVKEGHKDFDYQKLFREFWLKIPNSLKRHVLDHRRIWFLLSKLFEIKDKKNIKLMLKDATDTEKKDICLELIFYDYWDLLEFFIQECTSISSKDEMIKFIEELRELVISRHSKEKLEKERNIWSKFFQLLDNLIHKDDKRRNIEEGESGPAKGFRR